MTKPSLLHRIDATVVAGSILAFLLFVAVAQSAVPGVRREPESAQVAAQREVATDATGLPTVPPDQREHPTNARLTNREATIPPQCYTRTEGRHNPCYTCHQSYGEQQVNRLNQANDGALQGNYTFSDLGLTNHWQNLFVDRRDWLERISEEVIIRWISRENYSDLAPRLREAGYEGFVPDLAEYHRGAEAFDAGGFAKDGSGWVAYNYKPFPGTFWPTNGSTDDVLIRLPEAFRNMNGKSSREAYTVNLTLAEMTIKDIGRLSLPPTSEKTIGRDLDGDGTLGEANELVRQKSYVGDAESVPVIFQQLPAGTELMHSVRYLGVEGGRISIPPRMKELRYMKKLATLERRVIDARYAGERKEKRLGELPRVKRRGEEGLDNGLGWLIKGFIEDYDGSLRPQTFEEDLFCVGCHKGLGSTIDSTFSLARKVPGQDGWGYVDLTGLSDVPNLGQDEGEVLDYLRRVGGGNEFRENAEMQARWFAPSGELDEEEVKKASLYDLITPSVERALDLNRAYTHIVRHQSFIRGRDATWAPARNVLSTVDQHSTPLDAEFRRLGWDIRLDWGTPATAMPESH